MGMITLSHGVHSQISPPWHEAQEDCSLLLFHPWLHRNHLGTSYTCKGPPQTKSCPHMLPHCNQPHRVHPLRWWTQCLSQEKTPGKEAHAGSGSRLRNIRERRSRTPVIQGGDRLGMSRHAQPEDPQSMRRGTTQGEQAVEPPCQVPRVDRSWWSNTIIEATHQVPRLVCRDATNDCFHTLVEKRTKQNNGYSVRMYWVTSVVSSSLPPPGLYSPPGSSVHRILQARILEWVAMLSSRGSSWPRGQMCVSSVSCTGKGFSTTGATWEDIWIQQQLRLLCARQWVASSPFTFHLIRRTEDVSQKETAMQCRRSGWLEVGRPEMTGQEVVFTGESPLTRQHGTHVRRIILTKDFKGSRERGLRELKREMITKWKYRMKTSIVVGMEGKQWQGERFYRRNLSGYGKQTRKSK